MGVFENRADAGRQLLEKIGREDVYDLVLGVPRGGIPVAAVVSRGLRLPLHAALSNKIRAPWNPELAVGAVGEDGSALKDPDTDARGLLNDEEFKIAKNEAMAELRRRIDLYGSIGDDVRDKRVLLVDDGAATGLTLRASLLSLRNMGAGWLSVALPVASPNAAETLREESDETLILIVPVIFRAVGQFYRNFGPVRDGEVLDHLWRNPYE